MLSKNKNIFYNFLFDTAIIGTGPAGLSAAIRARFIKSHGAYPMSTILFESCPEPGGLAAIGSSKITGPSFQLKQGELSKKLLKDADFYDIPIITGRVCEIIKHPEGMVNSNCFSIVCDDGESFIARSVILACGMRPLAGERAYLNKGVEITYMGYDFIKNSISKFISETTFENNKFMIYGNIKSLNLINFVTAAAKEHNIDLKRISPIFLITTNKKEIIKSAAANKIYRRYPYLFTFGRISGFETGPVSNRLAYVLIHDENSGEELKKYPVNRLLLDYNSFELSPDCNINIAPSRNLFDNAGFVKINSAGCTAISGLFAAGDICGPYYSVSRAIAGGITAAFSAYEYVMRKYKKISNFSMFAYKASDFTPAANYREIITDIDKNQIMILSSETKIKKALIEKFTSLTPDDFKKLLCYFKKFKILGASDFNEILKITGISGESLNQTLESMILKKLISIYT